MRLVDLDARFLRREVVEEEWTRCLGDPATYQPGDPTETVRGPRDHYISVDTLAEADGVCFMCPKCFEANGGEVGTHLVLCWRPRVPADVAPKPGRWEFEGTGLADLTLVAGSSSVLLTGDGCKAHFHVRGGAIVMSP